MNVIVCIKQVPDPEEPGARYKVDPQAKRVILPREVPLVINPYDEQALEAALRVKEQCGGKITVISVGDTSAVRAVRKALAMGADEGILISDEAFEGSDSFSIAHILEKAIQEIGVYDLILCGRQAADTDAGVVGSVIAENLGISIIAFAKKIEALDGMFRVERIVSDGYEVIEVRPPAVVTVSNEIGQPRLASGWGIMAAVKKEIPTWKAHDLRIDTSRMGHAAARSELVELYIPVQERKCQIIMGENAEETAGKLALALSESGII